MILRQAPTVPDRVPVSRSQFPGPIYWRSVARSTYNEQQGTSWDTIIANLRTSWEKIPQSLREVMSVPPGNSVSSYKTGRGFNIVIGEQQFVTNQAAFGFGNWSGLYMDPRIMTTDASVATVVHEFGHHVDWHHHDLYPDSEIPSYVSSYAAFSSVRQVAWPTIITSAYARTNQYEWFAEAFAAQVDQWHWGNYLHIICGGSEQLAVELRMAFLESMPMPSFASGRFDVLPSQQAPGYVDGFKSYFSDVYNYYSSAVPTPELPADVGTTLRLGSNGILFTGYPWPTFLWEVNYGSGWQTVNVSHSNPILIWTVQAGQALNPQFRCTATNSLGSATTPVFTLYTKN